MSTVDKRPGTGIVQAAWSPSVVEVGDRITGTDVSQGCARTGTVTKAVGPLTLPGAGGYRYWITDTGEYYADGRPIETVVTAESWADGGAR